VKVCAGPFFTAEVTEDAEERKSRLGGRRESSKLLTAKGGEDAKENGRGLGSTTARNRNGAKEKR
jgi:hypothetical protein